MVVGENLMRLSGLDAIDLDTYRNMVQPRLFELIHNCKDPISQQYLMDCVIQVFADGFHLHTLERLLEACTNLHSSVDVKTIMITLMNRLSSLAETKGGKADPSGELAEVDKQVNIFGLFQKYIDRIFEEQGAIMDLNKLIELELAFVRFAIKLYPGKVEHVNVILESAVKVVEMQPAKNLTPECLEGLVRLLGIPLESFSLAILDMSHYPALMQHLTAPLKKSVAKQFLMVPSSFPVR